MSPTIATPRPNAVQFMASEMPFARIVAFWLGSTDWPATGAKDLDQPLTVPRRPRASPGWRGGRDTTSGRLTLGSSRSAASSIAAWTSSSGRFTLTRARLDDPARAARSPPSTSSTAFATSGEDALLHRGEEHILVDRRAEQEEGALNNDANS